MFCVCCTLYTVTGIWAKKKIKKHTWVLVLDQNNSIWIHQFKDISFKMFFSLRKPWANFPNASVLIYYSFTLKLHSSSKSNPVWLRLFLPLQPACVSTPKLTVISTSAPSHAHIPTFLTEQVRDSSPPWAWKGSSVITATIGVTISRAVHDPWRHLHRQHCDGIRGDWGPLKKNCRQNRRQRLGADKRRAGREERGERENRG